MNALVDMIILKLNPAWIPRGLVVYAAIYAAFVLLRRSSGRFRPMVNISVRIN